MTVVRVSPSTTAIACAGSQMVAGIRTARNGVFAMSDARCVAGDGGFGAGNPPAEESGFHVPTVRHNYGASRGGVGVQECDCFVKREVASEDGRFGADCYAHGLCDVHLALPCRCVNTVYIFISKKDITRGIYFDDRVDLQ